MLLTVTAQNSEEYQAESDQAFSLRHKVFVEKNGWTDLWREDGREMDRFDDEHAVHMLFTVEDRVVGYQRMLAFDATPPFVGDPAGSLQR